MLSPFALLRVNFAKHLQHLLEHEEMQILRFALHRTVQGFAQDDLVQGS